MWLWNFDSSNYSDMRQNSKNEFKNNQHKNVVSYIYSHHICISLFTNEVKHIRIYLLAIWIFSPMIHRFESCTHFSTNVYVHTDVGALYLFIYSKYKLPLGSMCYKYFLLLCGLLCLSQWCPLKSQRAEL